MAGFGSVTERLAGNSYTVDGESHIEINQELVRKSGAGKVLQRVCPAHVYSENEDGTLAILFAACMECGTCRALVSPDVLQWHYPNGGFGVAFREG
jgi:ferredoxin like protein